MGWRKPILLWCSSSFKYDCLAVNNLYHWKEEIVIAPPGRAANGLMIYIHSTVEKDIDMEKQYKE